MVGDWEQASSDEHVHGTVIRFMGEYGCDMPLWDEEGPLPNDPEWLARELGLSLDLVVDLASWGREWDNPDGDAETMRQHAVRGELLFERLSDAVPTRFRLVNKERRSGRHTRPQ